MAVKIDSLEQMIESYVINSVRENHPELDANPGSVLYDTVVAPLLTTLTPLIETINKLELNMDMVNAPHFSDEELDRVGENNYFIKRNPGTKAVGVVAFQVTEIPPGTDFVVPNGTIISTSDGTRFRTIKEYTVTSAEAYNLYNHTLFLYEIPVPAEAEDIGDAGNVDVGRITRIDTPFNSYVSGVVNYAPFSGGKNKESNEAYIMRIKDFYTNNFLGTESGYRNITKQVAPEVKDIEVVGFRNPYMHRDMGNYTMADGTLYEGHIGGKVDLYLKGFKAGDEYKVMELTNGRKKMEYQIIEPTQEWGGVKTVVIKASDMDKFEANPLDESIRIPHTLVIDKDINMKDRAYVEVFENTIMQLNLEHTDLAVLYNYKLDKDAMDVYFNAEEFKIAPMNYVLESPVINPMVSLRNLTSGDIFDVFNTPDTYYQQMTTIPSAPASDKLTYRGTILEEVHITLKRQQLGFNGEKIEHLYTKNLTISNVDKVINLEENRIITTDVLVRPADIKYVNIKIKVNPKDGYILNESLNDKIYRVVSDYIETLQLGDYLDESDVISELYAGEHAIRDYVDYVELPFASFYPIKEADRNKEVIEGKRGDFVKDDFGYDTDVLGTEIPIRTSPVQHIQLNKLIIEEVL